MGQPMDDAMFNDLTRSLVQAAAHARGETVPSLRVHFPSEVDVAAIQGLTLAPQIITTPAGNEFAILPRRDYDALLARLGDEAAEDRATARIVDEHLAAVEAGTAGPMIPHWFVVLMVEHGSPIAAAREHRGCTHAELAAFLGISRDHLSEIEQGRRALTQEQAHQIAAHTGVEAEWLL